MLRILLNESLSSDAFEDALSKKAFSRTTTSHIHAINKVNLTELERNCFGWTNLHGAMLMFLCCCFSTSPLCRGLQYFDWIYSDATWSARYSVLSILDAGVICMGLFRKIFCLAFFNSGVLTWAQIQTTFILARISQDSVVTPNMLLSTFGFSAALCR